VAVSGLTKKNPHVGSSFESWLDEIGIREGVTAAAIKAVARQLANKRTGEKVRFRPEGAD
jgi:antitoxin HicB